MTVFGVWRCSTVIQDQERQVLALEKAGAEKIYGDKITGTSDFNARPELKKCLAILHKKYGIKEMMVTRTDAIYNNDRVRNKTISVGDVSNRFDLLDLPILVLQSPEYFGLIP